MYTLTIHTDRKSALNRWRNITGVLITPYITMRSRGVTRKQATKYIEQAINNGFEIESNMIAVWGKDQWI